MGDNRDVFLQDDVKNTMDRACEQQGSLKENENELDTCTKYQRDGLNFWNTKKRGLGKLTLTGHSKHKMDKKKLQVTYLMGLCKWMSE